MTELRRAASDALLALDLWQDGLTDPNADLALRFERFGKPAIEAMRKIILQEQKQWVGLTKEEVDSWELPENPTVFEFAKFIETKLKEKNT